MRNILAVTALLVFGASFGSCGGSAGSMTCRSAADCGGGSACLSTGVCAPKCASAASCLPDEKCSSAGGCVPKTGCGADPDCGTGQVCEGVSCVASCVQASCPAGRTCLINGHCEDPANKPDGGGSCGGELFQATKVEANFLIVLDRSGSMEETLPAGQSKWSLATASVKSVTAKHETAIRFGLSMFPGALKCTEGSNVVPVGDKAAAQVAQSLPATATGSSTPIGAALLLASKRADLVDPARANFVLLVTDGMENCGGNPVAAVKAMAARGIKTYVVGFGADVDPTRLAQLATEGGTARLGTTKYYQADDQTSLDTAFGQIAQGASGCDFKLAKPPADLNKIFVAVDGNLINRDQNKQLGWDYNPQTGRLTLYGGACDVVQKSANPKVQIVYGCPDPTLIEGGGNGDGGYPPPVSYDGGIN
ncbi:MAG: putative secreted protein [Myxococcaceae bacterium]|nr:putative secreted protein [Myxococcaceae bacterium]